MDKSKAECDQKKASSVLHSTSDTMQTKREMPEARAEAPLAQPTSNANGQKGKIQENWRKTLTEMYPTDAGSGAGCHRVPHLHLNKVPYRSDYVPGTSQPTLILRPPSAGTSGSSCKAAKQATSRTKQPSSGLAKQNTPAKPPGARPSSTGTSGLSSGLAKLTSTKQPVTRYVPSAASCSGAKKQAAPTAKQPSKRSSSADPSGSGSAFRPTRLSSTGTSTSSSELASQATPSGKPPPTRPSSSSTSGFVSPPKVLLVSPEGTEVQSVVDSDLVDDFAQNHLLTNLHALGKSLRQLIFIVSQFDFIKFPKHPAYRDAAERVPSLPNPAQLDQKYSKGEADVVLFHRYYGVLIIEMKGVGNYNLVNNKGELADAKVTEKIQYAIEQLYKSETVIRHLMSDIAPGMTVRKALCFPYIKPTQLQRILTTYGDLRNNLCQVLGAADLSAAVQLCLCADRLSDHESFYEVSDTVLSNLTEWWRRVMTSADQQLTGPDGETLFLDMVARFVIPCSSVDLYTTVCPRVEIATGQAVAELGRRLSTLVLTEQELNLLDQPPNFAFLHGPPGTGKSVMLVLHALRCLMEGRDVHIVSTRRQTLAASYQIENQLQETVRQSPGSPDSRCGVIRIHMYDFDTDENEVQRAIEKLKQVAAPDKTLCVFMDEVVVRSKIVAGPRTKNFLKKLMDSRTDKTLLRIWCAGAGREEIPDGMEGVALTTPLRSAPSVRREVAKGLENETFSHVPKYDCKDSDVPGHGPQVIKLHHLKPGTPGSLCAEKWPVECENCGRTVAAQLRDQIGVCKEGKLQFRDVVIITRSSELFDEVMDDQGQVTSPACGFVRGLRAKDVPVCVIPYEDKDRGREELNTMIGKVVRAEDNVVTVTVQDFLLGLERRVVVQLAGVWKEGDGQKSQDQILANDRVFGASRCTTQLIIVEAEQAVAEASE